MTDRPSGIELMRQFIPNSPFAVHVGLVLERLEPGLASVRMPFHAELASFGETIHGGALSTLADVAAAAAAWSTVEEVSDPRGATAGMTVDFLAAVPGRELIAEARVLRRTSTICFCEVDVTAAGELVAKSLVTYKLRSA
jgi:uncharacterized protein (TIGR00369 family)